MRRSSEVFRVGTRPSNLARVQTRSVIQRLAELLPGIRLEEVWVRDRARNTMTKQSGPGQPRGAGSEAWQVEKILARGYGLATFCYNDIEPDFDGGIGYGVRPLFLKPGQTAPSADEWGAIGAWAWGLSRAIVNKWIDSYYPKEGRKEAEEKSPPANES